jgi:putative transposase
VCAPNDPRRHRIGSGEEALAKILPHLETEIVKRSDHANGFVVLPRRWVIERTIAWLNRCRRLAKD